MYLSSPLDPSGRVKHDMRSFMIESVLKSDLFSMIKEFRRGSRILEASVVDGNCTYKSLINRITQKTSWEG